MRNDIWLGYSPRIARQDAFESVAHERVGPRTQDINNGVRSVQINRSWSRTPGVFQNTGCSPSRHAAQQATTLVVEKRPGEAFQV